MRSRIYYFSGTGNSLAAARRVASELVDCELVPMAKALKEPLLLDCRNSTVGFVFPNYYMGLPNMVANFLKNLKLDNPAYLFAVVTSGHPFGVNMSQLNSILNEKGLSLSYGSYITMPDNYLPYFNITPAEAQNILSKADEKLEEVAKDIASSKTVVNENTLIFGPLLRLWNKRWAKTYPTRDRYFTVSGNCRSCSTCAKVCPSGNILMKNNRPMWRHRCEQCLACIHYCPNSSIQYGNKTKNKHRYHHPDASPADIAGQKL